MNVQNPAPNSRPPASSNMTSADPPPAPLEPPPSLPQRPPPSPSPKSLISLPSHYISQYQHFVRAHAPQITQLESLLNSVTYILPSHASNPIPSECLHTFLTLLTSIHTSILSPSPSSPDYHPTATARYQTWASELGGALYRRALGLLRFVQYVQLLLEMVAKKRRGERARWRVVVLLECVKAVCRVIIIRGSGSRMAVGTEMGGEVGIRKAVEEEGDQPAAVGEDGLEGRGEPDSWKMPRTGLCLPKMPQLDAGESVAAFLESRVLRPDEVKAAQRLVHRLKTLQGQAAEAMYVLRPVLYALALQRVQGNKKDWRPWLLGLGMELASRELAKKDAREKVVGGLRGLSGVEREEMTRRGWSMGWWGMRGAFYENFTGRWVKGAVGKLKGKPLLDMVGSVIEDYEWLWEEYYFTTSTL